MVLSLFSQSLAGHDKLTMSAVGEVLDPFIEKTGRTTAGSHSLSRQPSLDTSDLIFFKKIIVSVFLPSIQPACTCIIEYLGSAGLPKPLTPIKLLLK